MTEATAFLRAICDRPDDDDPRLVYADWLDERGDPRGEFIRLQIELARLLPDHPHRPPLERRQAELRRAHDSRWRAELPELPGLVWGSFSRGFVGSVVAHSTAAFLSQAPALFAAAPMQRLRVFGLDTAALDAAFSATALRRLRELELGGNLLRDFGAQALAECPHLGNITALELHRCEIGDLGAQALANTRGLPRLTRLGLAHNDLGPVAVRALLLAPFNRLSALDLGRDPPARPDLDADDPSAPAEHRGPSRADPAIVTVLASTPQSARLRELSLSGHLVGVTGVRDLTRSPHLAGLQALDLSRNEIGAAELEKISPRPYLVNLTRLVLRRNSLGTATAAVWSVLARLPNLRHLDLSSNDIDDTAAIGLANSQYLQRLARLDLANNPIGDAWPVLRARFGDRVRR